MHRFVSRFLLILLLSHLSFGQDIVEDENWLKGFKTEADYLDPLVYWDMKSFTLDDVARGKIRLKSVRQFTPQDEWEGMYYANTGLGDNRFIWNSKGGFFSFYFYHTLKSFNFGDVKTGSGFIELQYEKLPFSVANKGSSFKARLIKVSIGETHFLVPESRLRDFCERAAGLSTDLQDFFYYWMKYEDMHKTRDELPVLPAEYQKLLRHPIQAKIVRIGKRHVIPRDQSTIPVALNAGHDKKLKKDMNFFVEDLGEWVQLAQIYEKTSVGFIQRELYSDKERCRDGERGDGQLIPCKVVRIGMKAVTRLSSW